MASSRSQITLTGDQTTAASNSRSMSTRVSASSDLAPCRRACRAVLIVCWLAAGGCYAPLVAPSISARHLPDTFRTPSRTIAPPLNFANLTVPPPEDYLLGKDDIISVTIPDLFPGAEVRPLQIQVMASGEIHLPQAGRVNIGGMNLLEARQAIYEAYAPDIFRDPQVNIALARRNVVEVVVLGEVASPGVVALPQFQNDVGHALAAASGLTRDSADFVEVHRRVNPDELLLQDPAAQNACFERIDADQGDPKKIIRIPFRGLQPGSVSREDVTLAPGDVVMVPNRKFEVFFVVGQLDASNLVRFSVGDRERELGSGLILPRDRDIDVVTAVAMAGDLDPIDSPTTVTVHRRLETGETLLVKVDILKARYDPRETILVKAGDIIYVNPDPMWWLRRQLDRVVPQMFLIPYNFAMTKWFF